MAVTLTFCNVGFLRFGASVPAMDGESMISQSITASASNQQSSAGTLPIVRVATDAAIYVAIGTSPDATVTTGRLWMPASSVEYFQIEIGNKVAVITG